MDYVVRIKKNDNPVKSGGGWTPPIKYIKNRPDLRRASDEKIKAMVKEELRKGIDLNPKYRLTDRERVYVLPNVRTEHNRRQLEASIYTGPLDIPQVAVRKQRKKRKQEGYR